MNLWLSALAYNDMWDTRELYSVTYVTVDFLSYSELRDPGVFSDHIIMSCIINTVCRDKYLESLQTAYNA